MTPIKEVGGIGIVTDIPAHELPLNAWTGGRNVRFRNGAVEKFTGHSEVYATPLNAPYWLIPVASGGAYFWVYPGATAIGATDGASHADVTRVAGPYAASLDIGWTGTTMNGIVVVNDGVDVPQMWTPSLANKFIALTAWNANHVARSMRSLKRYLVALNITKLVTRYTSMIKWSDQAPSNAVPASWDETDPTLDAGEFELPSEGGFLIDGIALRDDLMLYKESQSWLMQYVGGVDIFRFTKKFDTIGMLASKCAAEFFSGMHVVFTGDDVVKHDGQQAVSLISKRLISSIAGQVDSTHFGRSFVSINFQAKEVWVCFPETGSSQCTKALVWNWVEETWSIRELNNVAFIAAGIVDPVDPTEKWSGATGTWATDAASWGDRSYEPSRRKMLLASPSETKLHLVDSTNRFNGVNMTAYVEKTGIGFPLNSQDPPDYTTEKLLRGIWPRITGTAGGIVNVYVGTQEKINDPVVYEPAFPFTIGSTEYVDCLLTSKLHAIKFESTSDINWKLTGYDADVVPAGQHGNR